MTITEDIDTFRLWATNLGCPPDAIPTEDALKCIFKSRQRDLFTSLMERVQPRHDVQAIRENILIKKMKNMKDKLVPACIRSFLPREMQTYLKMQEYQQHEEQATTRLADNKKEFDALAAIIKAKNMQIIGSKHKRDKLEEKCEILDLKIESLAQAYMKEKQNNLQLLETMPVALTAKNASEIAAMKAVECALKELDNFYNLFNNNNINTQNLTEIKQELWQQMRTIFANIPNFLIFNAIMRLKEEQLQHIMTLSKTIIDTQTHSQHNLTNKEPLGHFEVRVLKTKADLLGLVAKYLNARNQRVTLEEQFSNAFRPFVDELQKKINHFNAHADEDKIEEVLSDFIVQYNRRNFSKSQNEYLQQQIEQYGLEIESNVKQLSNHQVLLGSIKQVYSEISISINRIQYEMQQLTQIKEKILYSKNMLKNMLDNVQASAQNSSTKPNFLPTKLQVNNLSVSLVGGESFELGNDSVFCSTKLDFDVSTMNTTLRRSLNAADKTLMPTNGSSGGGGSGSGSAGNTIPKLPSHQTELSAFAELSLEKLSCVTPICAFYLSPNPLIIDSRELASTRQLAPGLLLTPYGALQEVRKRIEWATAIAEHAHDVKMNFDIIIVDPHALKLKRKQQHEHITQLLDSIDLTTTNTKHALQRVAKIYEFIVENPMRHFIPATKCFNNQTYAGYESEYIMYYRMATVGATIK